MDLTRGHKQTEVGIIPNEWDVVSIGDMEPFVTSGSRGWAAFYSEHGSPFIRITNLSRESIALDMADLKFVNLPTVTAEGIRTQLRVDDVLISITADIGIIGYVSEHVPFPAYINQHIALIRFDRDRVNGKFVSYFLASEGPQKLFRASTDTGAKAGMSLITVQKIRLALPPLPEQRAIAAALSDVDALLTGLERLIAKKHAVKQAAMQQLLTGKTRLPGFSGEWEVKRLGEIAEIDPENLNSSTHPDYTFKYISLEDVDVGVLRGYTEQILRSAPSRARRKIRKNDVLVSTVRPNLKSHLIVREEVTDMVCSTGFSVVRCWSDVAEPAFVYSHLFADHVAQQIDALLTGSNYPAINGKDVRALQIPLPSLPEQTAIATVLSDMDAEIAALEQRCDKTRLLKQGMMQELLTGRIRLTNPKGMNL